MVSISVLLFRNFAEVILKMEHTPRLTHTHTHKHRETHAFFCVDQSTIQEESFGLALRAQYGKYLELYLEYLYYILLIEKYTIKIALISICTYYAYAP